MISWIQRTFQQHFKWLFIILLGTVIVSFVFITNTSGGLHQAAPKIPDRPFFDLNLSSAADQQRLMGDTQLSIILQRGSVEGISPDQIEDYAKQRYAALHLAEAVGLPNPTQEEIAEHVRSLGAFRGTDGKFDAKRYADFRDRLKTDPRMTEADVARVMLGDLRFATYRKLLAGPGYVLPADIAEELARSSTRWSLALATVDSNAFAPSIEISDTTLVPWFEANARRYEIPARVSVASVEFLSSQFSAGLTFTDADLRAAYDANPARFPADDKALTGDAAFAAVRTKVETTLRAERSARAALAAASDLAVKLVEQNVKLADLPAFLAKYNLTLTEAGLVGRDIASLTRRHRRRRQTRSPHPTPERRRPLLRPRCHPRRRRPPGLARHRRRPLPRPRRGSHSRHRRLPRSRATPTLQRRRPPIPRRRPNQRRRR
jgi:peptidyl-prolyl cis-trans isomerase D